MTIAGSVENFDRDAYKTRLADCLGIDANGAISLDVQPASVIVVAQITTSSAEAQAQLLGNVTSILSDPSAASSLLGVTVEAIEKPRSETITSQENITAPTSTLVIEVNVDTVGITWAVASVAGLLALAICWVAVQRVRVKRRGSVPAQRHRPSSSECVPLPAKTPVPTPGPPKIDEGSWEWPAASVKWGRQLGEGSFGSVYVVNAGGLKLAAKRMDVAEGERNEKTKMMRREALAMRCKPVLSLSALLCLPLSP